MKFTFITLCLVGLLGVGGYFAVRSLKEPASYITHDTSRIGDLHRLETEPQSTIPDPAPVVTTTTTTTVTTVDKEVDLETSLQGLIDKKNTLKLGSKGVNVGYIQQFMNIYFKKNLKVDNDFGKTLETNVKAYQKAVGVTQTGQIGPATLGKMVDWLNKNPQ